MSVCRPVESAQNRPDVLSTHYVVLLLAHFYVKIIREVSQISQFSIYFKALNIFLLKHSVLARALVFHHFAMDVDFKMNHMF